MPTATVVASFGRRGKLEPAPGDSLPYLVRGRALRPVCGDEVRYELIGGSDRVALVTQIEPRTNALERLPPRGHRPEVLAANLTHVCVVIAPVPMPDLLLMDRFLCMAELMSSQAAVIRNKLDLGPLPDEAEKAIATLPCARFAVSARTSEGLDRLAGWLGTGTAVLVGQSGVGKSALLNALAPTARAETGALSETTGFGRHTTTAAIMHPTGGGGRLIDTPGVRTFIPAVSQARDLQDGFPELRARRGNCRFADCRHLEEPDCAVKLAVDAGAISARRYESYRRLLAEREPLNRSG